LILINDLGGFPKKSLGLKKVVTGFDPKVLPVSQLANINAAVSSKINKPEIILINRIYHANTQLFPGYQQK